MAFHGTISTMGENMTKELNESSFDDAVLKSSKAVLVDFYASWCGPCVQQGPIIEKWADSNQDKIDVVKVNVDTAPMLASKYGVMSIPTLVVFKDGKESGRAIGLQSEKALDALVAKAGVPTASAR